jgi:hypothetical protein
MKRGHPVLGAVMGLLFGLSLALTLLVFGVFALDSILLLVLPVLLLVLGGVWGKLAPLGAKAA